MASLNVLLTASVTSVLLIMAQAPGVAYVKGNYMYHFWRGLHWLIDGEDRARSEISYGLRQLADCRRAVERRTEKLEKKAEEASGEEALAYGLVVEFHRKLRLKLADEERSRQERLVAAIKGESSLELKALLDDIRFVQELDDAALTFEVNAFFAEQRDRDFARGYMERERAIYAREQAAKQIETRAETAALRGEPSGAEYLREQAMAMASLVEFLKREYDLASDPEGMLRRYAFFAKVAHCYDYAGDRSQQEIWNVMRDTYRGKVMFAIQRANASGVDDARLTDIEAQINANTRLNVEPDMPERYHLVEMELPFFHYVGKGQEYGGTTEIANELLRQSGRNDIE